MNKTNQTPLQRLRHHVTGAIERGEKTAIVKEMIRDNDGALPDGEIEARELENPGSTLEPRYSLRDEGRNPNGDGESYAERNT